ncbi:MAG: hypothetical protein WC299_09000 [Kiritimatiellia bacterium]
MKYIFSTFLLVASLALAVDDDTGWSPAVNGLRARLIIMPPTGTNTPFCSVLIEMQNVRDVAGQMTIRFTPERLDLRVTDKAGKDLPVANEPYDGMTPDWQPIHLPFAGTIRFQVSFPGLGYNPNKDIVIVDVGPSKAWIIPQDGTTYRLSGKLAVGKQTGVHLYKDWSGTIELPKVEIPKTK